MNYLKIEPSLRDCLSGYEDEDRTKVSETCEVRMRFVVSKDFLDTGSTPVSSTILPGSQAERHQTLTLACGSSNLPRATI